ncbi:MAG: PhnD/SsuA/transferrin family substrate-binding protein [Granulosicoccaceae bacterium]
MRKTASLPWYDSPNTRAALDSFWRVTRHALLDLGMEQVPEQLDRNSPPEQLWSNSGLLLSQCCGPDLFTDEARDLWVIARPVFSDLDCDHGLYYSHIVSARHYTGGPARLVINSPSSRSGHGALVEWCAQERIEPARICVSGSHENSLARLRMGDADLAAVDAHSWKNLTTGKVEIVGRSKPALSPPYVTHTNQAAERERIFAALTQAIFEAGHILDIEGLQKTDKLEYQSTLCPALPRESINYLARCSLTLSPDL